MKATVNTVELEFASIEMDHMRTAAQYSDAETPFKKIPDEVTPDEVRQMRRVIESALVNQGEAPTDNKPFGRGTRTELLRLRTQMKQVERGIEDIENVY